LSFKIEEADLRDAFSECGELSDIHWNEDKETGKFYGTAFANFESVEAATKAVALSGKDILGRPVIVEFARGKSAAGGAGGAGGAKGGRTPQKGGKFDNWKPQSKPSGCRTCFLGNLSFQIDDADIHELFKDCGTISGIRWVSDKNTGDFKGCGFVEFEDTAATDKAIKLNNSSVKGRPIRVDFAADRAR
jgi:nucleolin